MPKNEDNLNTIQELRTIIQGLKLSGLSFVDEEALTEIRAMIKTLPSAEELNTLINNPRSIKHLQQHVGGIIHLIEMYSKKDSEYKVRYKSRTGLPPRYKGFEWREKMKAAKKNIVTELVKLSSAFDEMGRGDISGKLNRCAKHILNDEGFEKELFDVSKEIVTACNKNMVKEAVTTIDYDFRDVKANLDQIMVWIDKATQAISQKLTRLQSDPTNDTPKAAEHLRSLYNIWQQVTNLKTVINPQIKKIEQSFSAAEQSGQNLVPEFYHDERGKRHKIQWVDDGSGYEKATVNIDGNISEVQQDAAGNMILKPQTTPSTPADVTKKPKRRSPIMTPSKEKLERFEALLRLNIENKSYLQRVLEKFKQFVSDPHSVPDYAEWVSKHNEDQSSIQKYYIPIVEKILIASDKTLAVEGKKIVPSENNPVPSENTGAEKKLNTKSFNLKNYRKYGRL